MLHIPLESLCYIIAKAREFQAKEEVVIPDTPSSPSDDHRGDEPAPAGGADRPHVGRAG